MDGMHATPGGKEGMKRKRGSKEEVSEREISMGDHHFVHLLLIFNPHRQEQREITISNSAITLVERPKPTSLLRAHIPSFLLAV